MQSTNFPSFDFPNAIILYLALESLDALYLNSITEYMPTHLPTRFRSFSFASLHQYHHKRPEMIHEALDTVNGKTFRFHYMFDKNIRYLFQPTNKGLRCGDCDVTGVLSFLNISGTFFILTARISRNPRAIYQIVHPQFLVEPGSRQTGRLSKSGDLPSLLPKLG